MSNYNKVRLYRENKDNPLREEYLKEYAKLPEYNTGKFFIAVIISIIIGFIFFSIDDLSNEHIIIPVICIGIVNLIVMYKFFPRKSSEEIQKLNDKYKEKGFVFDDIHSVIYGNCYDYDESTHIFTCPFTGEEFYGVEGNKHCVQNSIHCPIKEKFKDEEYIR